MNDITLPSMATDILKGQYEAGLLGQNLHAAYWLHGRDVQAALLLLHNAHKNLAGIADAMGYTIARKVDPQAAIAALKARWVTVCEGMNRGSWPGSEADALAEIERIKGEIAMIEVEA